ncbi:hypothetical protein GBA52_009714 [Prunus armeniaca]|nr:hypothetical protein GBA52_009714 [Prunus armeniaca]
MKGSSSSLSSRSPSPRRRSKSKNISIDDLPDVVLIEILCRLSCNILISQCKCVCKHWFTLISSPCFIEHFLRHRSDKKAPIIRTLIDRDAEELNGILPSSKVR